MTEQTEPPAKKDSGGGYRKPPMGSRFKKGQCGNPKGRPKGSKDHETILRKVLEERVEVRERGRLRKMSKLEIGLRKLAHRFAESGDPRIAERILRMLADSDKKKLGKFERPSEPQSESEQARDEAILQWFIEQTLGNKDDPENDSGLSPVT
jgi:hypothetical protein